MSAALSSVDQATAEEVFHLLDTSNSQDVIQQIKQLINDQFADGNFVYDSVHRSGF